ncbi:MAG: hypothetical protein B5M53_10205 [Candidatus Cloacimonas sp. 4484_209]|nr:MAG: hypothetical protein B5M53_10205 [Candidatus Cloacimonas sp. 4484_209]
MFYKALITISFDDGLISQYENAFPLFKSRNIPATVFINTFRVSRKGVMGILNSNRMNIEQLRELQNSGWEIGSHTVFHPYLTKVNRFRLVYELKESKRWLSSRGFIVETISYPYGDYNEKVTEIAKRYYKIARIGGSKTYVGYKPQDIIDRFNYQGIRITKFTTVNQIKKWVDLAIEKKEWIHFNLHNVAENKKKSQMVEVDISMTNLERIILYISSLSRDGLLEPVTFYKGFEKYKELIKEYLMSGTSLA